MSTWTLAQLATAIAALPPGTTNAAAAAILAAQTTTVSGVPFMLHQAKIIVLTSPNASWARIVLRARQTAALPPVTPTDGAVLAAITITEMADTQVIDPGVPTSWAAWNAGIAVLTYVGDLIAADAAAIALLSSTTTPTWSPVPSEFDVAAAIAIGA